MFTGLISDVGVLESRTARTKTEQWRIHSSYTGLELGESIAVDGVCLTVTSVCCDGFTVELSPETLACTNLLACRSGDRLNLERALRMNDRLGGHFVSGHVDGRATLVRRQPMDGCECWWVDVAEDHVRYLIVKGSVALQGVSLTINALEGSRMTLMIIAHTLAHTALDQAQAGAQLNIEYDLLAKMVERQLGLGYTAEQSLSERSSGESV